MKIALPVKVNTNISAIGYNICNERLDNLKHAMQKIVELMTKVKDYNFKLLMVRRNLLRDSL